MTAFDLSRGLPVGSMGRRANGWWGMITLIATEGALFVYLLFSYFYIAVQHGREWLPPDLPSLSLSIPNTVILLVSGVAVWRGESLLIAGRRGPIVAIHILAALVLGLAFISLEGWEWSMEKLTPASGSFGSLYFMLGALHLAHLVIGALILAALALWSALGYFDARRSAPVSIGALYWYFVIVVWLAVFFTLYITPRLSLG